MNFQPPDPPEYGHCLTCKTSIHQDEVRGDHCIECEPEAMTNQTIDGVSRKSLEQALKLAAVFDDGGDGADAESARGVVWILRALLDAPAVLGEIDLTPKRLAHAEIVIEQQNNLIASLRAELVESYRVAAQPQGDPTQEDRETLIGYGRSSGLDEASTHCSRMAYAAYYPPGTRFKAFTPKAQKALGDLLIKAANEIASLPGGPYERFKARQAKKSESAKSR